MGNEEQKLFSKKYSIFFSFLSYTVNSDFFYIYVRNSWRRIETV